MLKVVIAGGFGAGKTTAVRAVSEITPLSTEEYLTEASCGVDSLDGIAAKKTTTVAFDFGRLSLSAPVPMELFLFGTPGQDRFVDLWYDLSRGAVGAIVLVDTRRLEAGFTPLGFFEDIGLPFVVAVNEFDAAHRYHPEQVRTALELPAHVPVIAMDARDPNHVAGVLLALVGHVVSTADPVPPASATSRQDAG
ncbi:ATP/GTP binding protein [Streptomyces albus]|uniref:ATP/GTP binding protein n=1 Tax=Streptomyces albus (strain ATCC 21838 / DSM 41398 / FERM P-419 / JCM 4703 / NBRC 107858) TaxID=1081613 RepID=A0A0B5F7E9_STRA4|nr:ATP/GTP binding protein [Streptomyces albus]AOU81804.1 ATP/GTP binding protein [Streptomyces albus]AYN37491.1 ATP/GTP binding protein [Streptomyces albus]